MQLLSLQVQLHVSNLKKKMGFACYISAEFICKYKYINFQTSCKLWISKHCINCNETAILEQMRGRCSHFTIQETVERGLILPRAQNAMPSDVF